MRVARTIDPQARVDGVVQQIDDQIDDDEDERDQTEIGRHHRDVDERNRLEEQQPHPRPLKNRLGDDRERDEQANLQAGDRDHRNEGVLQRVTEMYGAVGQTARARELDVIGAQHLEHLRAHEPHQQRELEKAQCHRWQDDGLETLPGREIAVPSDIDRRAASERREPVEPHRKRQDQNDPDEERRQRNTDERGREQDAREHALSVQPGIYPERHADREGEHCSDEHEFEGRGQTYCDRLLDRNRQPVRLAEVAPDRVADEAHELDRKRIVQPECLRHPLAILDRRVDAHHVVDRIADEIEQRERDECDREHDKDGLEEAADDEGEHERASSAPRPEPARAQTAAIGWLRANVYHLLITSAF